MRGDVPGSGESRAFEPGFFDVVAFKGLHPQGEDGNAFVFVDGDDFLPRFRLVEVRMNAADFDGIEPNGTDFLCDIDIVFEGAEAVALYAEGERCFHNDCRWWF